MDKFSINWRRIGVFVGMAVLVLIVIEFNTRLDELNQLTDDANVYRAQATPCRHRPQWKRKWPTRVRMRLWRITLAITT
jgi:hypothetical protein